MNSSRRIARIARLYNDDDESMTQPLTIPASLNSIERLPAAMNFSQFYKRDLLHGLKRLTDQPQPLNRVNKMLSFASAAIADAAASRQSNEK
jgi:hypothetical protein